MAYSALVPATPGTTFVTGKQFTATHAEQTRLNFIDHEARIVAVEGFIRKATVVLTDAQIKALPTTPITLVAAPGSGFYLSVLSAELKSKFDSGAYTNVNTTYAALGIAVGTGGGASGAAPTLTLSNDSTATSPMSMLSVFLGATSRRAKLSPYLEADGGYVNPGSAAASYAVDLFTDLNNVALTISADNNGSGDFTGGHAANTLTVVVLYTVEAVP
jgi:hypothetical protein